MITIWFILGGFLHLPPLSPPPTPPPTPQLPHPCSILQALLPPALAQLERHPDFPSSPPPICALAAPITLVPILADNPTATTIVAPGTFTAAGFGYHITTGHTAGLITSFIRWGLACLLHHRRS